MGNTNLTYSSHFWTGVTLELAHHRMSIRALARAIGVSPSTLTKYSGSTSPSLEVAAKIAAHLQKDIDSLMNAGRELTLQPSPQRQDEGRALGQSPSPEPGEDSLLARLEAAGFNRILASASRGGFRAEGAVLDVLCQHTDRWTSLRELKHELQSTRRELPEIPVRACLATLIQRGLVLEQPSQPGYYRAKSPVAEMNWTDITEQNELVGEMVLSLVRDVLPIARQRPADGTFFFTRFPVDEKSGHALLEQLVAMRKSSVRDTMERPGDREMVLMMAGAVTDSTP